MSENNCPTREQLGAWAVEADAKPVGPWRSWQTRCEDMGQAIWTRARAHFAGRMGELTAEAKRRGEQRDKWQQLAHERNLLLTDACAERDKARQYWPLEDQQVIQLTAERDRLAERLRECEAGAAGYRRAILQSVNRRPVHNRDDHTCELCEALKGDAGRAILNELATNAAELSRLRGEIETRGKIGAADSEVIRGKDAEIARLRSSGVPPSVTAMVDGFNRMVLEDRDTFKKRMRDAESQLTATLAALGGLVGAGGKLYAVLAANHQHCANYVEESIAIMAWQSALTAAREAMDGTATPDTPKSDPTPETNVTMHVDDWQKAMDAERAWEVFAEHPARSMFNRTHREPKGWVVCDSTGELASGHASPAAAILAADAATRKGTSA